MKRAPTDDPKAEVGSFERTRRKKAEPVKPSDPPRVCGRCRKERPVMMEMSGDAAWFLCVPCWREGVAAPAIAPAPTLARELAAEPQRNQQFHYTGGINYIPDDDNFW